MSNKPDASRESIQQHREAGTCYLCSKPVDPSQGYHGATGAHWACAKKLTAELNACMLRLGGVPRRREGDGVTALRAKAKAVAAIERALGSRVYNVTLWNQKGVYRGPRWDLDSWGLHFEFDLNGNSFKGQASSLATMTQCCSFKRLLAVPTPDGSAFSFDLSGDNNT